MTQAPPQPVAAFPENPYAACQRLQALLASGRGDFTALRDYVEALLALGLGQAARDFLERASASDAHWIAVRDSLIEQTRRYPAGLVTWSSRRRRFQANLQAVGLANPSLAAAIAATWENASASLQLHQTSDGNFQVLSLTNGGRNADWLGGLNNHKDVGRYWTHDRLVPQLIAPLAFDGVGLGWLLRHVMSTTERTFLSYSPPIYVIEPDLSALAILFHLHDLRELLAGPRLRLFGGSEAATQFAAAFEQNPQWSLPAITFNNALIARPSANVPSICETLSRRRKIVRESLQQTVAAYYADKDVAYWHQRFATAGVSGPPLRVLGITSRYTTVLQYTMAELGEAISAAGAEFRLNIEPDDQTLDTLVPAVIAEFKPDLLILISRMRHEHPDMPANVPFLCWDQDALPTMRTPRTKASLTALTYVAGVSAHDNYITRTWPTRNSIYCHLAAATYRYTHAPVPAQERAAFACDFSFVSNASATAEVLRDQTLARIADAGCRAFYAALADQVIACGCVQKTDTELGIWVRGEAEKQLPRADRLLLDNITADLRSLADRVLRHVTLGWVAAFCRDQNKTLKLFGRGWESHPHFAAYAAGPIGQGQPLRALYQATKINLQMTRWGFLHSRPLDGVAAGGFFLTNWSINDYELHGMGDSGLKLSRRALELNIGSLAELEASPDPVIRALWPVVLRFVSPDECAGDFPFLRKTAHTSTTDLLFADLPAISFKDQNEFSTLASRYLDDEALRGAIAQRMRQVVQKEFSYDARWRLFVGSIADGLKFFASQPEKK